MVLETLRDTHSTSTDGEKGPLAIVLGKYAGTRPFEVLCCELINVSSSTLTRPFPLCAALCATGLFTHPGARGLLCCEVTTMALYLDSIFGRVRIILVRLSSMTLT